MPSLFRFLLVLGIIAALIYGAMIALVTFVDVTPRTMEQAIPSSRLNK